MCVWILALVTGRQTASFPRRIVLPSVAWPALQNFPTLSHKQYNFRVKSLWTQNVCFDFLNSFCPKTFLILWKFQLNIIYHKYTHVSIISTHTYPCKVSDLLVGFQRNLDFLKRFLKHPQISNFAKKKKNSVAAKLLHANGRTDGHKEANSCFSQFCESA